MVAKEAAAAPVPSVGRKIPAYYLKVLPTYQPSPSTREMLINHAHFRPEEIDEHLFNIREQAWDICPSPFIGSWTFLTTRIDQVECYRQLLDRLKSDENRFASADDNASSPCQILDAATGLGQDLRRLIHDGVPPFRIYACDIEPGLWKCSLDLWRDESLLQPPSSRFCHMDLTKPTLFDKELSNSWKGAFDFVFAGHLLDSLSHVGTIAAASNLARLTRGPGSEILLWQTGGRGKEVALEEVEEVESSYTRTQKSVFLADEESLKHIWEVEVLQQTGLRFQVVKMWTKDHGTVSNKRPEWLPPESYMLESWLRRL